MKPFHLSLVATGRNDNHGGSFLYRMQHFVDGFIEQCKKHQLKAELIIVEWNPPEENEPLYKALKFPEDKGPCAIRFIRVPKEIHMQLKHSEQLQLFQMIGKNVGIRRALGEFVLATNIDILFSDPLIQYIRNKLQTNVLYRVDRLDVPSELPPNRSFNEILDFCAQSYFRINGKYGTLTKVNGKWSKTKKIRTKKLPSSLKALLKFLRYCFSKIWKRLVFKVHTNACGDFTLMSYQDWNRLRGYPEWEIFSWHLDSVLLYQAKQASIKEIDLKRKMAAYHIEHGFASGYTPEGHDALFQRLKDKGIPFLTNDEIEAISFRAMQNKEPSVYNDEHWGMAELSFEEIWI